MKKPALLNLAGFKLVGLPITDAKYRNGLGDN